MQRHSTAIAPVEEKSQVMVRLPRSGGGDLADRNEGKCVKVVLVGA